MFNFTFTPEIIGSVALIAGIAIAVIAFVVGMMRPRPAAQQQAPAPRPAAPHAPAPQPARQQASPPPPPAPPKAAPQPTVASPPTQPIILIPPELQTAGSSASETRTYGWLTITECVLVVGFLLALWLAGYVHWGPGLLLAALMALMAWYSYRDDITVDPPRFARVTVWNHLLPWIIRPRIVFAFEYFPLIEKLQIIDETPEIRAEGTELIFKDVRCKADPDSTDPKKAAEEAAQSGGSVEVHVGTAIIPDEGRSGDFFKAGKINPIMKMLHTRLGANIRHLAAGKTWEELTFSKATLSMYLITDLTGHQPTEIVLLDPKGNPLPDVALARPHHKYLVRPRTQSDIELNEYDAENFINTTLVDRPPDVHGLGVRLAQLGVTDIIPEGELKGVADLKAREKQERRGEAFDFETERQLADRYMEWAKEKGSPITAVQALEYARINRKRAQETIVRSSGNPLLDAAALVGTNRTK